MSPVLNSGKYAVVVFVLPVPGPVCVNYLYDKALFFNTMPCFLKD